MYAKFQQHLNKEIADIKEAGLYKNERIIVTPQGAEIKVSTGQTVLNFCANNYLGLSNNPKLIAAAKEAMDTRGYGMSSVRFICGTQDTHKKLEQKIAEFLEPKTLSFMQLVLMLMAVCLNLYWEKKMLSFPIL